jgi:hypothetical protein
MKAILLALAALTPLIGAVSAITIPANEDSTVSKGKVTVAAGRAATLGVDFESSALLKFDLPPGLKVSHVLSARLRLYVRSAVRVGHLQVKEALSTWSEDVANESLTLSEGTVALPDMLPVNKGKQFVYFDVTDLVKSWIGRESGIFGVAVTSCGDSKFSISSKEGSASGYPAELEIDINPALPLFVGGDPQTELWDGAKIAEGSVGTPQLTDNSVVRSKIASGAVGSNEIAAHSILANHLANGSVGNQQIAQGAIDSAKLALGSVGAGQLAPGSVGETQLAAGSVNALNIALGAVGSEKLNLQYAKFWDEKPGNVDGGSAIADGWQRRTLNTEDNESNGAITLSENTITLQPGVYLVFAQCPANGTDGHQAALCDVSGEERQAVLLGTTENSVYAFVPTSIVTQSTIQGFVKVEGEPKKLELWHYTYKAINGNGLGVRISGSNHDSPPPQNSTLPSIYSTISILKIK